MSISRRRFLKVSAASAAAAAVPAGLVRQGSAASLTSPPASPVVIASGNGLRGVELAHKLMTEKQTDPLDAAIAGVNIQELDPQDQSVGLGGLPNEHGVVQLDASCMHGPTKRAGAVAALEGIATPSLVAKAVMDYTDHVMMVGEGAKQFALNLGFEEQNLLTEKSRQDWLRWKARLNPNDDWLDHDEDVAIAATTGTINMCAVDSNGDLGSVTTTSGLSWKIPGRAGDSPIIGAGQYCDNTVGAAGSTGRGEANIKVCGAFLIVELMRGGASPAEACRKALERAIDLSENRLMADGKPLFNLSFYALRKDGQFGSARIYGPTAKALEKNWGMFAVATSEGARLERPEYLYKASERPKRG